MTTGKLERWTESETGGLNAATFSEPELVRWKSFDGKTISGFLYKPNARFTGPRPVIVNIHGGPEGQSQPGFLGRGNYYLDELGVAVIYPNVRGSTGYGKTFAKLDNGVLREDSVKDIGALLDWIPTRQDLDASRVMVTGGSYGGYMTLAVATHYDAKIRCSLDVVGISNFVTFLENTEAYRRDLRRVEYGDERDPAMKRAPAQDLARDERAEDHQAAVRGAGQERPARALHRVRADGRHGQEERRARLVPARERRGPRLRQEEEPGLPVLRDDRLHPRAPAQL